MKSELRKCLINITESYPPVWSNTEMLFHKWIEEDGKTKALFEYTDNDLKGQLNTKHYTYIKFID